MICFAIITEKIIHIKMISSQMDIPNWELDLSQAIFLLASGNHYARMCLYVLRILLLFFYDSNTAGGGREALYQVT